MSGKPGLPLPDWLKWLDEKFNPLVETVDKNQSTLQMHETRIAALEINGRPQEPGPPEEPEDPEEPVEPDTFPAIRHFETIGDIERWATQVDPSATHSLVSVAVVPGNGELTDVSPVVVDDGPHFLYVRALAPDEERDEFFIGFKSREPVHAKIQEYGKYVWVEAGPFTLRQGTVEAGVGPGDIGLLVDCFVVATQRETPAVLDEIANVPVYVPPAPDPDPVGFGDDTHKVAPRIDESFDPKMPTLRNGERLTSEQKRLYDAMVYALLRDDPDSYTSDRMFDRNDSYYLGRHGQIQQVSALLASSRTGDARVVDELVRRWNLAYKHLVTEWDASNLDDTYILEWAGARVSSGKWVLSGDKTPWSPYPKWLYGGKAGRAGAGTDLNNLQNIKPWAILTQFLWVLEINRGKKSPAGYDYGKEADKWREPLRGFIDAFTINTSEPWAKNYKGLDGGMLWGSSRTRAKPGQWPFFVRGEGHAIYNSALFCFYCSLLGERGWDIPNWQGAMEGADVLMRYIRDGMVDSVDSKGKPSLIARGGGAWRAMNATYTNYLAFELQHIRDIGRWNDIFTSEDLLRLSRSYVDMHRPDGTTLKNLASERDRTGHGLDVSTGSDRSQHQQVINGFCAAMWWEEGDYLFDAATVCQNTRFGGGYETPKAHILPALQFVDRTGVVL